MLQEQNIDRKVEHFHKLIRVKLDEFFPEKTVMISYLEKKWMNPHLKNLLRKVKREFYQKRKSPKWRKLKKRFKKLKQKTFYSNFVTDLKASNPSKWYSSAKRIGVEQCSGDGELTVECLQGLNDQQASEKVQNHSVKYHKSIPP